MRSFLITLALCSFVVSCDDHHDEESRPTECKEIITACHEVDKGSGPIHDCHENAEEEWTQAQCVSNKPSCLAMCAAAGADGGS